ncbi:stromal interaction molecule homolog isoform X2 [Frankliniella occidentalis]|uniref:Stromal interaction molecule homolog isoform X2 n=1 Tax=Frankliniella occidentalis TaxID=133901 RepID=A0A6J1SSK1_FRAOC|nr:stromal interaction molecule homolog isoform X2 [Frankliniella occidentalis]
MSLFKLKTPFLCGTCRWLFLLIVVLGGDFLLCNAQLNFVRQASAPSPSAVSGDPYRGSTLSASVSSLARSTSAPSSSSEGSSSNEPFLDASHGENCNEDIACLTIARNDMQGLEAIKSLHRQLDDDANGNVDLSESDEFLREELKYEQGYEKRQKAFHRNDDMHISVRELWEAWLRSEVHNWTVEQTTEWLASNVELPQYIPTFIHHRVTGALLPRLAVSNMQYLTSTLGIKDPIHKQKIQLKAMDVVLFGPPKDGSHHIKDLVLVTLLVSALTGCWYAYTQNKSSKRHLRRMMKDMESLHKAEQKLENLQKELEQARLDQENVATEKQNLERRLAQECNTSELRTSYSDLEVSQLKTEIETLRNELARAEGELQDRCWAPPHGLQQWLQLTHEIENKSYIKKKISAEKQLQQARDACEKLRKKRSSLVGAFVSTHGRSIDDVDRSIVEARTALNDVTQELQERVLRWKQIELLCGFNIINNSGLQYLESVLYRSTSNGRGFGLRSRMGSSQDDLDDDTCSLYSPSSGALEAWVREADSSGSEAGRQDIEEDISPTNDTPSNVKTADGSNNVHFLVGGESAWPDMQQKAPQHPLRQDRKDIGPSMIRSQSQDADISLAGAEISPQKIFHSETSLQFRSTVAPTRRLIREASKDSHASSHGSSQGSSHGSSSTPPQGNTEQRLVDEEACSTDSNPALTDDDISRRKKKHKLHFPSLTRRLPKGKTTVIE